MTNLKLKSAGCNMEIDVGVVIPEEYSRVFIMLHGHNGTISEVNRLFSLDDYAEKYHLLIAVPELGNDYYLDRTGISGEKDFAVSEFLGNELPAFIKHEYGLNEKTEVILGGYSMGGFGTMLHGLNMPDKFAALISVSGAFIANEIAVGSEFVVGDDRQRKAAFEMFMIKDGELPFDVLPYDCKRNPEAAAKNISEEQIKFLPAIVLTCGAKDIWCMTTHRMKNLLEKKNIGFSYMESPEGEHEFGEFDRGFRFAFDKLFR